MLEVVVLAVSSFMLLAPFVRGWMPVVLVLGEGLFVAIALWGAVAITFIFMAPPWVIMVWVGILWLAPIVSFLLQSVLNSPIELLINLPATIAQAWAITSLVSKGFGS